MDCLVDVYAMVVVYEATVVVYAHEPHPQLAVMAAPDEVHVSKLGL